MKLASKFLLILFLTPLFGLAQEEEEKPKSQIVELLYLKPEKGKVEMLKKAIAAHNKKYHAQAPYGAGLYNIVTGNEAGMMVWAMGPFSYTELDDAPGEGEHMKQWRETVDPYVAEYGRVEHWRYNKALSHRNEENERLQELWFMDVENDEYYRFKEFMSKVQKVMAKMDDEMEVWNTEFNQQDGRDVAIIFTFSKWADRDMQDWKMEEEYDAMHGDGSWDNALEEFKDFTNNFTMEVWRLLLP